MDDLISIQVASVSGNPRLNWAEGGHFIISSDVALFLRQNGGLDAEGVLRLSGKTPSLPPETASNQRLRCAFTKKPVSSQLPFSYQQIPQGVRTIIASIIGRIKRPFSNYWASFPQWPLDLSTDFLEDLSSPAKPFNAFFPTPVLLTHDIDSKEGLDLLLRWFLDREEASGAQSTNFIVPKAWEFDIKRLKRVRNRGHFLGIHGFDHSNLTPFAKPEARKQRLEEAKWLINRFQVIGYRAPSLLRTRALLRDLSLLYRFDSSIPTSGGLFPVPNNGCASARPFWVENIYELPLTLPRDGSLLFLGYSPEQIADMWIQCAERISRSGGVVMLLTHCESRFSGNPEMMKAYDRFLGHISASPRFAWSDPRQLIPAHQSE